MSSVDFDRPGRTVKSPAKLAHVVLRTNDIETMSTFYQAFLGAHVAHENEVIKFLTYDEEHHRIALIRHPECQAKVKNSCGLEHFSFTFDTLQDLLLTYRQRLTHGIKPVWCVHHGPMVSLYYRDPDGNMIETQWDTATPEQASVYMMSEAFAINPFGVDFDPEEWIEKLKHGATESDFEERPPSGPRGLEDVPAIMGSNQGEEVNAKRNSPPMVLAAA